MKELEINKLRVYKSPKKGKLQRVKAAILAVILSASLATTLTGCSTELLDKPYKFENAVLTNYGNSVVIPVTNWRDYKGQSIQIVTDDNMAILSSSYFVSLIKGAAAENFAFNYANGITDLNGTMSLYLNPNEAEEGRNYLSYDTVKQFDKAIIFHNDRAIVLPISKWWDYSGEQIQITTPDGTVILASNYNTILVADNKSKKKAIDLANMIVGENGVVFDYAGDYEYEKNNNYGYWDNKYLFNKAIMIDEAGNAIVPLKKWKDYDGEQFQLTILDGPITVCSSFNTILVNDTQSTELSAKLISEALNTDTIDYTVGIEYSGGSRNRQGWDSDNSFQNAQFINGTSGVLMPIQKWNDYNGEQLQFNIPNGVTILGSAFDARMFSGTGSIMTSDILTNIATDSYVNLDPLHRITSNNKKSWDTNYTFPYAIVVRDDSIVIFSVYKWRDYSGGEKLRITLTDEKTVFLSTAYDTKLVNLGNSGINILDVAEYFNDGSKKIVDLTDDNGMNIGKRDRSSEPIYNYAIAFNRDVAVVMPIDKKYLYPGSTDDDGNYTDYSDQVQVRLVGQLAVYSDLPNFKLVCSDDEAFVIEIARSHISEDGIVNMISSENDYVYKYVPKK